MKPDELSQLLDSARNAQARLDWSAQEYGFETRLAGRLQDLERPQTGTLELLWKAVAGCAACVGMMAVWFVLSQAPLDTEDDLSAFWDGGQTSYDVEFLD